MSDLQIIVILNTLINSRVMMHIQVLTNAVRANLWPGTLVWLPGGLRGLPEDTRISGPGGHATATEIEASLSQTVRIKS